MKLPYGTIGLALAASLLAPAAALADSRLGKLAGTVVDYAGKPQMGAAVTIAAENRVVSAPVQTRTNQSGHFESRPLPAGIYSVRVTLAGFLPALDQHVRVTPNFTTILKLELDSVLSSMATLRRQPELPLDADEWDWVLRTSAATRPVLRWRDAPSGSGQSTTRQRPRGRVELTSGSLESDSFPGTPFGPVSAFAYDQSVGGGRLILAGQYRYEGSSSAGLAATWLPLGDAPGAPRTTIVAQQFRLGPGGPTFRGLRTEQTGEMEFGRRVSLRYGAQYVRMGFEHSASSLRPQADLAVHIAQKWTATASAGARPLRAPEETGDLEAALAQFDLFPAVMFSNGRPMLEGAWHEELGLERRSGNRSSLAVAVYQDSSRHTPVFARAIDDPDDAAAGFLSFPQAVNGGSSSTWGTRAAYRQKFGNDLETTLVYAYAGALSVDDLAAGVDLRGAMQTRYRHSLAAKVSGRMPRFGTRLGASYKWLNRSAVSRQDPYGEIVYDIDPFLNFSLRQPLPIGMCGGKLEVLADLRNVLAQGYISLNTPDGRVRLIPARQILRGGLSFQF